MSDTVVETPKERYREIRRLWDKAANDDWRGPVKVMHGFEKLSDAEHLKWLAEHPEEVSSTSSVPTTSRSRFTDL